MASPNHRMASDDGKPALPKGWVWATIGDASMQIQYGYTEKATEKKVGPKFLRITDIQDNTVVWENVPYVKIDDPEKSKYLLHPDDLVFARTGATVGKSYLLRDPIPEAVFASYLIRMKLSKQFNPKFVYNFFQSGFYWEQINKSKLGIGQPNVNGTTLTKIVLPLPPLPEQHRIVAKIEELFTKLDAGVAALKKAKAQLQRYRQSVLKDAFSGKLTQAWREAHKAELEPAAVLLERIKEERKKNAKGKYKEPPPVHASNLPELPEGWVWARVGEISEIMQYGTSEKANENASGIPVLRMGNIQDGKLDYANLKYFPKNWPQMKEYFLDDGDVLFNRTNSAELVGKTAVYKRSHPKAVFASYLIRVKVNREFYVPDILSWFINSFEGRKYISSMVSQQVGQANVNGTKIFMMPVPFLTLLEQRKITEEIERRFSIAEEVEKVIDQSLKQAEALRQSILKRAFAGKLVPQNPNDEPAEKLLERIKTEKAKREAKRVKK